jgi:hypothetical protein
MAPRDSAQIDTTVLMYAAVLTLWRIAAAAPDWR